MTASPRRQFFALLRVQLRALFTQLTPGRRRSRAVSGAAAAALIGFLCLYLSGLYAYLFAGVFAPMGALDVMLLLLLAMACCTMLLFSLTGVQGLLFGGRDLGLLFPLPVSPALILCAKAAAVYLECLLIALLFALPAGVAYLAYGGGGGAAFLLLLVLGALFLPLLPTLLAIALGFLLSAAASRMKRKRLASNLLSLLLFLGLFFLLLSLNRTLEGARLDIAGIRSGVARFFPAVALLVRGAVGQDAPALLGGALIGLLPSALALFLLAPRYRGVLARLASHTLRSDYRLAALRGGSPLGALLRKEARRYFGSTVYLFNTGFGLLLMLAGSVYLCFAASGIDAMLAALSIGREMLLPALVAALCLFAGTAMTTGVSISLEGKQLWILKEAPLPIGKIFAAKIGFNLLLTLPCLLLCSLLLTLALGLSPGQCGMLLLLPALHSLLCASGGLMVNLLFPKLDFANDAAVVKQSLSAFIGIFAPMLLLLGVCALYLLVLSHALAFPAFYWLCCAACALLIALLLLLLRAKGRRLFAQL